VFSIAPPWRADGYWKELPQHFFNRQSAISNRQLKLGLRLPQQAAEDSFQVGEQSDAAAQPWPRARPHVSFLGVNQPVRFEEPECVTLWRRCS
jgi:hypothetical protein